MSKLYGYLEGDRGPRSTRASNRTITSMVQTQNGRVTVNMNDDGSYVVAESHSGGHYSHGYSGLRTVASGNVDSGGQARTRGGRYRLGDERPDRLERRAQRRSGGEGIVLVAALGLSAGALILAATSSPAPPEIIVVNVEEAA